MSSEVEKNFNIKDTGALGVYANYMSSTDTIPTISTFATPSVVNVNEVRGKKKSIAIPQISPVREMLNPSRPVTPSFEISALPRPAPVVAQKTAVNVSNFEIGFKLIGDLTGKDKIAKIALYSLRIIAVYAERCSKYYPYGIDGKSGLLVQLLKSPRLLLGFLSKLYLKKSLGTLNGLSLYRQLLRFGKTPFRIRNLIVSLVPDIKFMQSKGLALGLLRFYQNWFNESKAQDLINLYYGITDELLVLYKLGVLSHAGLRKWAGTHECYSWYLDILLGLKQNIYKLQKLNEREAAIKLNQQVRIKARQVIKNLKMDNASSPIRNTLTTDHLDLDLISIAKEKQIVQLSIAGLICDFCFDTVDVFNLQVDRPVYLSFGLLSACFGATKLYIKFRDELLSE